jgi:hypothetical protein
MSWPATVVIILAPTGRIFFDAIKKWSKGESLGLRGWIESCFKRPKRIISKKFYA